MAQGPDFDRITRNPAILGGQPTIGGMRITVSRLLQILALNPSWDDLRADYPEIDEEDIRQALDFAAHALLDSSAA